jgi:hypothetical protein
VFPVFAQLRPRPGGRYAQRRRHADHFFGINHPIPGSDSQGNPDLRKITRNLSLTFAAFGDTGQKVSCPAEGCEERGR